MSSLSLLDLSSVRSKACLLVLLDVCHMRTGYVNGCCCCHFVTTDTHNVLCGGALLESPVLVEIGPSSVGRQAMTGYCRERQSPGEQARCATRALAHLFAVMSARMVIGQIIFGSFLSLSRQVEQQLASFAS